MISPFLTRPLQSVIIAYANAVTVEEETNCNSDNLDECSIQEIIELVMELLENISSSIPPITINIMESRFCNVNGVKCTPEFWLTQQGQELYRWPRMGTLNVVKVSESSALYWPQEYVYDCAEDSTVIFPLENPDMPTEGTCGCYHCERVWKPPQILDLPKVHPIVSREPGPAFSQFIRTQNEFFSRKFSSAHK